MHVSGRPLISCGACEWALSLPGMWVGPLTAWHVSGPSHCLACEWALSQPGMLVGPLTAWHLSGLSHCLACEWALSQPGMWVGVLSSPLTKLYSRSERYNLLTLKTNVIVMFWLVTMLWTSYNILIVTPPTWNYLGNVTDRYAVMRHVIIRNTSSI